MDTLIKYLINSLQRYENGHGNALQPVPTEIDKSFNGDHMLTNIVTGAEIREMAASMQRCFNTSVEEIKAAFSKEATALNNPTARSSPNQNTLTQTLGSLGVSSPSQSRTEKSACRGNHPSTGAHRQQPRSATSPGLSIPNISRGPEGWWEAVKQWNEDDPLTGMPALKNWRPEWYDRGGNKIAFGMKRTQRRYIAEAFERYVDINSDPA